MESIRLPARSPNLNAFAERFVRSIKSECLENLILVGEPSLRRAVEEFCIHYHEERNHQGLGNKLIEAKFDDGGTTGGYQGGLDIVLLDRSTAFGIDRIEDLADDVKRRH